MTQRNKWINLEQQLSGLARREFEDCWVPRIATFPETMEMLINSNVSISRYGEGEFRYMVGGDPKEPSRAMMRYILSHPKDSCAVAINRAHFYWSPYSDRGTDKFVSKTFQREFRNGQYAKWVTSPFYWDSTISIPAHAHEKLDADYLDYYYRRCGDLFRGKRLLLVTGDGWLMHHRFRLFHEYADQVVEVPCPSRGAVNLYKEIEAELRRLNKHNEFTVVACCGFASTILAYDLSDEMRVLDLGHLPAEYDSFKRNRINAPGEHFWT